MTLHEIIFVAKKAILQKGYEKIIKCFAGKGRGLRFFLKLLIRQQPSPTVRFSKRFLASSRVKTTGFITGGGA